MGAWHACWGRSYPETTHSQSSWGASEREQGAAPVGFHVMDGHLHQVHGLHARCHRVEVGPESDAGFACLGRVGKGAGRSPDDQGLWFLQLMVLGTGYRAKGTGCQAEGTGFRVLKVQGTGSTAQGTEHRVHDTGDSVECAEHRAHGTGHGEHAIGYRLQVAV